MNVLAELEHHGLRHVLELALERFKRDEALGKVSGSLEGSDRVALERLLGKSVRALDLAQLDAALRASRYETSLVTVLEVLHGGPIQSRKSQRENRDAQFVNALNRVSDLEWRDLLEHDGAGAAIIKRSLRENVLCNLEIVSAAISALRVLPERLTVLAANLAGDAHAFDRDRLEGRILLAALDALGLEKPVRDGVSSSVLVANLPVAWLAGRCVHLPWREVVKLEPQVCDVLLVENPAVFEGLLESGVKQPIICTEGQPSAACIALLDRCTSLLRLSLDFDLGGLRIAQRVFERYGSRLQAWRFDPGAYRLALQRGGGLEFRPDVQTVLESFSSRFPELIAAMKLEGRAAHHEVLLPELIEDARMWSDDA
jgi:Protein of unknown function C-terminus (DUF2399)/Protein of unknown function N-terminus (DUF3323)